MARVTLSMTANIMNFKVLAGYPRHVVIVAFLAGCGHGGQAAIARGYSPQVVSGIRELQDATRPFSVIDSAVSVGYAREVRDCLVHEHHGAMGYHHVNPGFMDGIVDIRRPEILLYERLPSGEYRLNGVEFIVPFRAWPRDSVPPQVLEQSFRREDNLQFWYLHVWAWTRNAEGLFANFHPDVQCPQASRKVFRPSVAPS